MRTRPTFLRTLSLRIKVLSSAQAQFDLAWMTHDSKLFWSSKLLTSIRYYADKNTDNGAAPATGPRAI